MTNETLKNPSVPVIPGAVGIDAAIADIQLALASNLDWLEKSFGRAWTMPRGKKTEPMVYQGSSEYYPVLPNDALKSYSFFKVNQGRNVEDFEAGINHGEYMFQDPVDLIFWLNLNSIDPTKNYIFKEELIREVMDVLDLYDGVTVEQIFDDKADEIFKGYSLEPNHRDLLMYPFSAFRISMTLAYSTECDPEANVPTLPPVPGDQTWGDEIYWDQ